MERSGGRIKLAGCRSRADNNCPQTHTVGAGAGKNRLSGGPGTVAGLWQRICNGSDNPLFHACQLLSRCCRTWFRQRVYSFINVGGLAVGLAVATLIGLWMHDELTFNTYHRHYDRIARLTETQTYQGNTGTSFERSAGLWTGTAAPVRE
jgi:hypothetical protein